MLVSAELRWFWRGALPYGLEEWFRIGPCPPGGGQPRTDEYLVDPGQPELGVKKRGDQPGVEVKGLVAIGGALSAPLHGHAQIWSKWTSAALSIDHLPRVAVHKTRWLRKYDASRSEVREVELDEREQPRHPSDAQMAHGCTFELVALRVDDGEDRWWALGFEAFGPLDTVEQSLARAVVHRAQGAPPSLEAGLELSYPAWLGSLRARS